MTKVYMAVGIPAIGKSTYLQDLKLDYLISSDNIRECINGRMEPNPLTEGLVWASFRAELQQHLTNASDDTIGLDATFYMKRYRKPFLEMMRNANAQLTFLEFPNNIELALSQQSKRERKVPEEVIQAMHLKFQPVTKDELDGVPGSSITYTNP